MDAPSQVIREPDGTILAIYNRGAVRPPKPKVICETCGIALYAEEEARWCAWMNCALTKVRQP